MLERQDPKPNTTDTATTTSSAPKKSFQEMSLPEKKKYLAEGINEITRDLGRGTSGNDVLMLQNALLILGYMTVAPNGNFGPKTEDALARFKLANNLATDPNDIKTKRFGGNTKRKMVEIFSEGAEKPEEDPEKMAELAGKLDKAKKKLNRLKSDLEIVQQQKRTRSRAAETLRALITIGALVGTTTFLVKTIQDPGPVVKFIHDYAPGLDKKIKDLLGIKVPDDQVVSPSTPNPFFPDYKPPTPPPVEPPKETFDQKIEKLLGDNALRKKLEEATVLIQTGAQKAADGKTYARSCAGFIVDRQTVLTAAHCLRNDTTGKMKTLDGIIGLEEGGQLSRRVKTLWPIPGHGVTIATSGNTDFGLIRFDKPYFNKARVLNITNTPPSPGEPYIIMGHPMNVPWKMEGAAWKGVICEDSTGRPGNDGVKRVYELSGEVHGGNSGGPTVNAKGEVIGITVASTVTTFSDQKAYAIPLDQAYVQGMIHELLDEKPAPSTPKKENPGKAPKPKKKVRVPETKKHQKGTQNPRSKSIEDLLKQLERQRQEERLNRRGY